MCDTLVGTNSHTCLGSGRAGPVGDVAGAGPGCPHQTWGWCLSLLLGKAVCPAGGGCAWTDSQRPAQPLPCRRGSCRTDLRLGSGSQGCLAWALGSVLRGQPGLAEAQPQESANPLQAGGTVPAARTAGSSFADVSEEAQGLGWVCPISLPWDIAVPGPAGQRGQGSLSWALTEGVEGAGPQVPQKLLWVCLLSRWGAMPWLVIKLRVPTSLSLLVLLHPPPQAGSVHSTDNNVPAKSQSDTLTLQPHPLSQAPCPPWASSSACDPRGCSTRVAHQNHPGSF